jgi:hypothetical protein
MRLSTSIDLPSSTTFPPTKRAKLRSTTTVTPGTITTFDLTKLSENPSAAAKSTNQTAKISAANLFERRLTAEAPGTSVVPSTTSLFFKLTAELRYTVYDYLLLSDDQASTLNSRHICRGAMEDFHNFVLFYVDTLIAAADESSPKGYMVVHEHQQVAQSNRYTFFKSHAY